MNDRASDKRSRFLHAVNQEYVDEQQRELRAKGILGPLQEQDNTPAETHPGKFQFTSTSPRPLSPSKSVHIGTNSSVSPDADPLLEAGLDPLGSVEVGHQGDRKDQAAEERHPPNVRNCIPLDEECSEAASSFQETGDRELIRLGTLWRRLFEVMGNRLSITKQDVVEMDHNECFQALLSEWNTYQRANAVDPATVRLVGDVLVLFQYKMGQQR